jgi:hypothetical protein
MTSPAVGLQQAGDDAQQGGFAGAGTAEQADDLAGAQGEVDVIEHHQIAGRILAIGLLALADFQQQGVGWRLIEW